MMAEQSCDNCGNTFCKSLNGTNSDGSEIIGCSEWVEETGESA